jgi:5-formyltetrahydrofolate cyclo-ligase
MNKKDIRAKFLKIRSLLTKEFKISSSKRICGLLLDYLNSHEQIELVIGYSAINNEVDISSFLQKCLDRKILVFLPYYLEVEKKYILKKIESLDSDLELGKYNIPEPKENKLNLNISQLTAQNSLWLVPGIAFDINSNRIGFGKGYYDAILRQAIGKKIGVAFSCQISKTAIPQNQNDIPMDFVVSA